MKDRIDFIKNELRDEIKEFIYRHSRKDSFVYKQGIQQLQEGLYNKAIIHVFEKDWTIPYQESLHFGEIFLKGNNISYYKVVFDGTTPNIEFVDNSVKEEPTLTNKSITDDSNEPTEIEQEEYWHIVDDTSNEVLHKNFGTKEEASVILDDIVRITGRPLVCFSIAKSSKVL